MDLNTEIKSISDYFVCMNALAPVKLQPPEFRICRRDTLNDMTAVKHIANHVECCDHTLGEVAYSQEGRVFIWQYKTNTTSTVKNLVGDGAPSKALFYINGELFIIKEGAIYKYIHQKND